MRSRTHSSPPKCVIFAQLAQFANENHFFAHNSTPACRNWTGQDMADAFLMHSVLTEGRGAPVVLAVLFQAVCRHAGVPLGIAVTESGSQCVTWPQGEPGSATSCISVGGVSLVFDVASHGSVGMEDEYKTFLEVRELVPSQGRCATAPTPASASGHRRLVKSRAMAFGSTDLRPETFS